MLRRAWKPAAIATTLLVPTAGYYYYKTNKQETFEIPVRVKGADGKVEMSPRTIALLSLKTLETRIREFATFQSVPRPGGVTWKYTTAALPSNDPIEDANAQAIIQRDASDPSAPGDLLFFTVMDGHGGYNTSQLLSKVLIRAVAYELSTLASEPPPKTTISKLASAIWSSSAPRPDGGPDRVAQAIQNAFKKLDDGIVNAPLSLLAKHIDAEAQKTNKVPDLSQHPSADTVLEPAISGSCALMAVIDTASRDLYVACTGDSRAVAGVWEESADGSGSWKVDVLSEDQTGRNPSENTRLQSEHPGEEVVRQGRILGGLEPSRAFGDARYKWPRVVQETLNRAFYHGRDRAMRPPPNSFKTPPYVTAEPVVTHRKLSFLPPKDQSAIPTESGLKSELKFIVLATDGLWDELSSEEVVRLVGGHLAGLKGTIPRSTLSSLVPISSASLTVEGKDKKRLQAEGKWAFVDDNISAHLIRNAFGGGDESKLQKLLSIPSPYSRRYRDDVTVTVVWWETGEDNAQVSHIKAKL